MCRKSLWRGWSLQGPRASSRSPITSSPETLNWCLSWARAPENVHGFVHLLKLATQLPHSLYKELSSEYLLGLKPLIFCCLLTWLKTQARTIRRWIICTHERKREPGVERLEPHCLLGKLWHRVHTLCTLYALDLCFQTSPFPGGGILSPGEARG